MPTYDPQRSRRRQPPPEDALDGPAPVDALLEPHPVHLPDADIEVSSDGEEVVVHTADADIEIRPEDHELVVSTGDQDLYVELAPMPEEPGAGLRRFAAVFALVAATVLAVWVIRRRRSHP